jgi:hypothetical protein
VDFNFSSSNRKHVGGSSLTVSDDSNEADHSDLDHSEVEIESNKNKADQTTETKTKFEEVIIDEEENESVVSSCSTVPRPPTPPKVRTDTSNDLEQEITPSITTGEIQTTINENVQTLPHEQNENSSKHVHFSA